MWMTERAMEELNTLEARHPDQFDYLKLELRSLISDHDLGPSPPNIITPASSAGTQASSNRKRREAGLGDGDLGFGLEKKRLKSSTENRADMAIERARACLRRIRLVKESFLR
ncbi:hypothetical protein KSP40_PGU004440 [Platanthera guangdongensis]|uniref:Uncharacterized protein n=1 Tax=Platanthera guangdongensis TaxID=2320717 RepID=A0ABR2LRW2_9ASPA